MASYSNQTGLTAEHLLIILAREKEDGPPDPGVTLTAGGLGTAFVFDD